MRPGPYIASLHQRLCPRPGSAVLALGNPANPPRRTCTALHSEVPQILPGYVRALQWHSEIPQILLSGSWDATIKVWDASKGVTIYTSKHHHADVYGLSSHPARPFLFISSSRDSTLRLFTLDELAAPFFLQSALSCSSSCAVVSRDHQRGAAAGGSAAASEMMNRLAALAGQLDATAPPTWFSSYVFSPHTLGFTRSIFHVLLSMYIPRHKSLTYLSHVSSPLTQCFVFSQCSPQDVVLHKDV